MKRNVITLTIVMIALVACSNTGIPPASPQPITTTQSLSTSGGIPIELKRTDSQGSVEFVIVPINLNTPSETIDFSVVMDTHSVELSWNLAAQSVLTTNTSVEVRGVEWPVGKGHHVEGTLKFPTKTTDGKLLLDGAKKLTLTIKDAGAPTRVFEWILSK